MDFKNVYKVESLNEVLELLSKHKDKAKIIAGGTDIIISLKENRIEVDYLIDISDLKEIKFIKEDDDYYEIGANITFTEMINSNILKELTGLVDASKKVGSPQIRNRGTIGGNILNGSTAADTVPPLLVLDSELKLVSIRKERIIPLEKIYLNDGNLDIKEDELLYSIKFKKTNGNLTFLKHGFRKALAISKVNISTFIELDINNKIKNIKVASGAISKFPIRERNLESFLLGKYLDEILIFRAKEFYKNEIDIRLGNRPSKEYKKEIAINFLEKSLKEALIDSNLI